jgi:hypothetical protein
MTMTYDRQLEHVATFDPECQCGSVELFLVEGSSVAQGSGEEQQVFLTDGSSSGMRLSIRQLHALAAGIRAGTIDSLLAEVDNAA